MRKRLMVGLLAVVVSWAAFARPAFFIAPDGNDDWSGTLDAANADHSDGPFATPTKARDALRAARTEEGFPDGATVYLREGVYFLTAPLELSEEDSGNESAPVIWRAYKNENVRLTGGVVVKDWTPDADGIVKADLSSLALPDGALGQVIANGVRQDLARWPNAGEGELPGGGYTLITVAVPESPMRAFEIHDVRLANWSKPEIAEVSIWPNYNWWQTIAGIEKIDAEAGRVTLDADLPYTIEPGRRVFFQNIREELDAPGEWYYDAEAKTLYLKPATPIEETEVLVDVLPHLIQVQGGKHINIMGLTLDTVRGDAVRFQDAEDCLFAKSIISNTQGYGVVVQGGKEVRVAGNDIHHTGKGGIVLDGGDRKTLTRANHQAVNNHIHHYGNLFRTYQTAVNISGVGQRVANNLIHDAPHIGLLLNGNDHIIEYNEIHHVCMEGSDNGGFYMGRDWTQRGIVIRYNKFHDIYGFGLENLGADGEGRYRYASPYQAWGVYLDDCSSGVKVFGNLFYRVPLCGVMIGGGRDNVVENNIFVDCIPALHIDDRWDEYTWETMHERLDAMNVTEPPYSERYPALLEMGDDPRRPENNRFVRNVISYSRDDFKGLSTTKENKESAVVYDLDRFDPDSTFMNDNIIWHDGQPVRVQYSEYGTDDAPEVLTWEEWQQSGFDAASQIADPLFMNPAEDVYDLRHDSPALVIEFQPLPTYRMGIYQDELRATLPPEKDTRRDGVDRKEIVLEAPQWPAPKE